MIFDLVASSSACFEANLLAPLESLGMSFFGRSSFSAREDRISFSDRLCVSQMVVMICWRVCAEVAISVSECVCFGSVVFDTPLSLIRICVKYFL